MQTLYLLLVTLAQSACFFFPLAEINGYEESFMFYMYGIFDSQSPAGRVSIPFAVAALNGIVIIVVVNSILMFRNRRRQMLLGKLNLLLLTVLLVAIFLTAQNALSLTGSTHDSLVDYRWACYLPIASMVLTLLANRVIKKDDDLVRSVDRIR